AAFVPRSACTPVRSWGRVWSTRRRLGASACSGADICMPYPAERQENLVVAAGGVQPARRRAPWANAPRRRAHAPRGPRPDRGVGDLLLRSALPVDLGDLAVAVRRRRPARLSAGVARAQSRAAARRRRRI